MPSNKRRRLTLRSFAEGTVERPPQKWAEAEIRKTLAILESLSTENRKERNLANGR